MIKIIDKKEREKRRNSLLSSVTKLSLRKQQQPRICRGELLKKVEIFGWIREYEDEHSRETKKKKLFRTVERVKKRLIGKIMDF
jgi:hypothetical protein